MIAFSFDVEIARPVGEVFEYVTDPSKLAEWQTNTAEVEKLTDGPFGVGTRLREVHTAGRRRFEQVVEVSAYEPDRRFDLDIVEGSLPVNARHVFEATPEGTRLRFAAEGHARGALRLIEPLLTRVVKGQMKRHYGRLKEVLEAPQASA